MARLSFFKKNPNLTTLLALELGLLLLVSYQIEVSERISLLEKAMLTIYSPIQKLADGAQGKVASLSEKKVTVEALKKENATLRQKLSRLEQTQHKARELRRENERLSELLSLPKNQDWHYNFARVVGHSRRQGGFLIIVDKGSLHGIKQDLGVISVDGVAGVVWEVSPYFTKIMTINNPNTAVSALVQESRYQDGYVTGVGLENDHFVKNQAYLKNVPNFEKITKGNLIVTSGMDHLFPKGIPIGTVLSAKPSKGMFQDIRLKLATDFSRLEEVAILVPVKKKPPRQLDDEKEANTQSQTPGEEGAQ